MLRLRLQNVCLSARPARPLQRHPASGCCGAGYAAACPSTRPAMAAQRKQDEMIGRRLPASETENTRPHGLLHLLFCSCELENERKKASNWTPILPTP